MDDKLIAKVIFGSGKGEKIGFPTINLDFPCNIIPGEGVYIVRCWYNNREYKGVGSVGDNPTFKNKGFSIEIHLFNFDKYIAGQKIKVKFLTKLRNQKKFSTVKALSKQISKDVEEAKEFFDKHNWKIYKKIDIYKNTNLKN